MKLESKQITMILVFGIAIFLIYWFFLKNNKTQKKEESSWVQCDRARSNTPCWYYRNGKWERDTVRGWQYYDQLFH